MESTNIEREDYFWKNNKSCIKELENLAWQIWIKWRLVISPLSPNLTPVVKFSENLNGISQDLLKRKHKCRLKDWLEVMNSKERKNKHNVRREGNRNERDSVGGTVNPPEVKAGRPRGLKRSDSIRGGK